MFCLNKLLAQLCCYMFCLACQAHNLGNDVLEQEQEICICPKDIIKRNFEYRHQLIRLTIVYEIKNFA